MEIVIAIGVITLIILIEVIVVLGLLLHYKKIESEPLGYRDREIARLKDKIKKLQPKKKEDKSTFLSLKRLIKK